MEYKYRLSAADGECRNELKPAALVELFERGLPVATRELMFYQERDHPFAAQSTITMVRNMSLWKGSEQHTLPR